MRRRPRHEHRPPLAQGNRQAKTAPKRGRFWCPRCDTHRIGVGQKCVCGYKDTITRHRKKGGL